MSAAARRPAGKGWRVSPDHPRSLGAASQARSQLAQRVVLCPGLRPVMHLASKQNKPTINTESVGDQSLFLTPWVSFLVTARMKLQQGWMETFGGGNTSPKYEIKSILAGKISVEKTKKVLTSDSGGDEARAPHSPGLRGAFSSFSLSGFLPTGQTEATVTF